MKRRLTGACGAFSVALVLTACSEPMVRTQYDKTVSFSTFHTYAWQAAKGPLGNEARQDPTLDKRIRSAVDRELASKGWHPVSVKDADIVLDYNVSTEEKVDAHLKNYEAAEFMGITYTLGTLGLMMTRGVPPEVIWKGTVQANIDMSGSLEKRDQKLRDAVQSLLSKFPPK